MPSQAKNLFSNKLMPGVEKIIESHNELNPEGRGRRNLTHLTHGGVLMLCAAWELYIEEVLVEAVAKLVEPAPDPSFLTDRIKGKLAQVAKNDKHAHGALRLCNHGWKNVYLESAKGACEQFNTPKFGPASVLFHDWLDIEPDDLKGSWQSDFSAINDFVTLRGEIAHRGADATYVRRDDLKSMMKLIKDTLIDTDNLISDHIKCISSNGKRPWNKSPILAK